MRGGSVGRWRTGVGLVAAGVGLLVGGLVANTLRKGSAQVAVAPMPVDVDVAATADALAAAIRIPTVSHGDGRGEPEALQALHALLAERFPRVRAELGWEVHDGTLLLAWRGADPSRPAGVLLAHLDVVPAAGDGWTYPPFDDVIRDDHVWGRGAIDNKQNVIGLFTAVETLLEQGFRPAQTLYFVFGHDEEMGGSGAAWAAAELVRRKVRIDFVLDEGGMVADGVLDGLAVPAALIGVAEKGYASVVLRARADGGHSSMPPPRSAVGRLAEAVVAVETNPLPARLDGASGRLFDTVGPELAFPQRLVMANRGLLEPLLIRILSKKPSTNATIRTTQAVTMARGSDKDNVLPAVAEAVVNFRILPGDTTASVLDHVRAVVGPDIEVELLPGTIAGDPSPVSETDGPAWDALQTSIRQTWPDAVVAPFLFIGATDAKFFAPHCSRVWRFAPMKQDSAGLKLLHGADERIHVDNLASTVGFYLRFLRQVGAPRVAAE